MSVKKPATSSRDPGAPYAISITPASAPARGGSTRRSISAARADRRGALVHEVGEAAHRVDRSPRKDPVPEVEDVAGTTSRRLENRGGAARDHVEIREERDRIEIPLDAAPRPDEAP